MLYLKIAWGIVVNLAATILVFSMFTFAHTSFETAVMSSLILIYVAVTGGTSAFAAFMGKKWIVDTRRYIALARAQGVNTEIEVEALKEDEASAADGQTLMMINGIFNLVIALIAVWHLVRLL